MRLCRFQFDGAVRAAIYDDARIADLTHLAGRLGVALPESNDLLDCLPPNGRFAAHAHALFQRYTQLSPQERDQFSQPVASGKLLVPIAEPKKVLLLAGNYADHIAERGGSAAERQNTFPYFFSKPPSTTLTHPGDPVRIPSASPDHIDWELELGVVIGQRCRNVGEHDALHYVAGYTICNDISDRKFLLNPGRQPRERDRFFDWLHGKWHDTFLPMGPCILSAASVADPQTLPLQLRLNGQIMQNATTAQMVFPVATLVAILSSFVTLEPGDVINRDSRRCRFRAQPPVFLKAGNVLEAEIGGIGVLRNPVMREG